MKAEKELRQPSPRKGWRRRALAAVFAGCLAVGLFAVAGC